MYGPSVSEKTDCRRQMVDGGDVLAGWWMGGCWKNGWMDWVGWMGRQMKEWWVDEEMESLDG